MALTSCDLCGAVVELPNQPAHRTFHSRLARGGAGELFHVSFTTLAVASR